MGLSHDIISEFVKITNDKKETSKEGIVYATVIQRGDYKYVKIDGSDTITPADTTIDIEDGERVTVMIKDHSATVTGNITTPSASVDRVDKVQESVTEQLGVFELIVADKISANELQVYKAEIEVLIANKAEIKDLEVINAQIENLKVTDAEIENLIAGKATIEDLEAFNARIDNLVAKDAEIENAVIGNLEATRAEISILDAKFAEIDTLVNGNLTSDNILSFKITADKVTMEDAFIKDAMVDNISAGKINAGKINTNSVTIGSDDGGMIITGSTQQFMDKNGNTRIQIGKDASGDFTFILYGEDGTGQIINQNGITASAIGDGLIVNDMVSNNAAISGEKLDISSVITEINGDDSTTINSSKVYLDGQNQSLEVAFNSLKTQVDTIIDVTIEGDLSAFNEQIQSNTTKIEANKNSINTLISEDKVIRKEVSDLGGNLIEATNTLTSKYTSLQQNLDGFKTTVADTYTTKTSLNDFRQYLTTNYSTTSTMNSAIDQKVDEINLSISSTYATKTEVETLDGVIKDTYSTIKDTETAINAAKDEINLSVSTIYETKKDADERLDEYYTRVETDSQIQIATDNITSSVASTYTSKDELDDELNLVLQESLDVSNNIRADISTITSDDYITNGEKANLRASYERTEKQYNYIKNIINKITSTSISTTKLDQAWADIQNAYNVIDNDSVTGANAIRNAYNTFFEEYHLVLYTIDDYFNDNIDKNRTSLSILSDRVEMSIETMNSNDDTLSTITKHMKFDENGLELYGTINGEESQFKAKLSDTKLSFYDNNKEVAYVSNEKLNIENAKIVSDMSVGCVLMRPRNVKGDGGIVYFYDETLLTDQASVMTVRMDDGLINGKFTNLEVDE